ncbi:coil containing protein [Vibrio phage 1.032.O._10N.261.54.F5]|nr:coil containing protein [Vibrio phage 1.032.O._10N.261.54.F5]
MKYDSTLSLTANLINLLNCGNRSNIFDYVSLLRKERDEAQSQISELTKRLIEADLMRRNVTSSVDVLIKERGVVQGTINGLKQLLELPESAGLTDLFNAVEALELNKSERDTIRKAYNSNAKDWQELCSYFNLPVSALSDVLIAIDTLRKERDEAGKNALAFSTELNELMADELLDRLGLDNGYTPQQFHASMKALFNDLSTLQRQVETHKTDLEYYQTPQLSEIRYVLHGDIQPCSVLYSDDTTTLLRLDEGDIMCETDTIEWSDSVTYRCQELLRGEAKRSGHRVSLPTVKAIAQLVRDERILLNDDVDLGADEAYFREENKPCVAAAVVPAPPPFGHEKPDHNNPYVHTNNMFTEEAMRKHGWTSESLVSCGYGHYAPVQHPVDAERADACHKWESKVRDHLASQPKQER